MKVLIIGGTGLISTALTRQLLERGISVTVFNRGRADVEIPVEARKLTGDRYDPSGFIDQMRRAGDFDCVVDMITFKPDDAASLIEAFAGRTPHLIVCSTIDVYAKPAMRYPITEQEPHCGVSQYAKDKVICEEILFRAHADRGLPVTILRPAHTYGIGGQHRGHVIHTFGKNTFFLDRLRKGKPVIVHGDGSSLWASGHLEDVACGFAGAVGNRGAIGNAYHLMSDEWLTWNRYHESIAEAMNAPKPKLVHIPTELLAKAVPEQAVLIGENFQFNNIFDISAARRDLGFQPKIRFLDGMRDTIRWVEAKYGFDNSDDFPLYDKVIGAWERLSDKLTAELAGASSLEER